MEPTLANPRALDWLRLRLDAHRTAEKLVFRITFYNDSEAPQQAPFPQQPRNPEFLSLIITDETHQRVRPERKYIGRFPVTPGDRPVHLPPKAEWTYDLVGTFDGVDLDFPFTLFRLQPETTYQVSFACKQVESNKVLLVA